MFCTFLLFLVFKQSIAGSSMIFFYIILFFPYAKIFSGSTTKSFDNWHRFGGKYYQFFNVKANWHEAKKICKEVEGKLFEPLNIDELNAVTQLLENNNVTEVYYIGLHRLKFDGNNDQ